MVVIVLILLSLGVALFIMLSDTRRNNNFAKLEKASGDGAVADGGNDTSDGGGD
jgi:hypothetical protein